MKTKILRPQTKRGKTTSIILLILFFILFTFISLTGKSQNRLNEVPVYLMEQDSSLVLTIQATYKDFNKLLTLAVNKGIKARQDSEIMILDDIIIVFYNTDLKRYEIPDPDYLEPVYSTTKVPEMRKYIIDNILAGKIKEAILIY